MWAAQQVPQGHVRAPGTGATLIQCLDLASVSISRTSRGPPWPIEHSDPQPGTAPCQSATSDGWIIVSPLHPPCCSPHHAHDVSGKDYSSQCICLKVSKHSSWPTLLKKTCTDKEIFHLSFLTVWVLWFNVQWRCEKKEFGEILWFSVPKRGEAMFSTASSLTPNDTAWWIYSYCISPLRLCFDWMSVFTHAAMRW